MMNLEHAGVSVLSNRFTSTRWQRRGAVSRLLLCLLLTLGSGFSGAQADSAQEPEPRIQRMQSGLEAVEEQRLEISGLEVQLAEAEGVSKSILEARVARAWAVLLKDGLSFAAEVMAQKEAGEDVSGYEESAVEILEEQENVASKAMALLEKKLELPGTDLSAADEAAANARWFRGLAALDRVLATDIRGIDLSRKLDINVDARQEALAEFLESRAASNSILLEAASSRVLGLQASVKVLPADAELAAKLQVAEDSVKGMAAALESVISLLESQEIDATEYRAQVLQATGELTTDILKPSVITGLLADWWEKARAATAERAPSLLFNLFLFLLIVFIARKLSRVAERLVEHSLSKSHLKLSQLLHNMVVSIARNTVMVLGVLIGLSQIGVTLGPLLAGLGVAGFVIGFALQDTLSNFASGMMILIYRPFDVGDLVEVGGVFGTVAHMSLVNTTIMTLDNQTIVIPNNKIWGDVIRNVTNQSTRRVDITFGISYTDDIPKTERVLGEIVDANELILKDPETLIRLHELGDSSVNFVVRAWTRTEDYWDVYWYLMRTVKMRFDDEGISIPFPQRDVHVYSEAVAALDSPVSEVGAAPGPVQGRPQISDSDD